MLDNQIITYVKESEGQLRTILLPFLRGSLNLPAWAGGRGGVELARGRYGFQIERSALPLSLSLSLAGGLVGTLGCERSILWVV